MNTESPRRGSDPDGITARSAQGYCVYQFRHAGFSCYTATARRRGDAPPRIIANGAPTTAIENVEASSIARRTI